MPAIPRLSEAISKNLAQKGISFAAVNHKSLKEEGLYSEYTRKMISEMERLEAEKSTVYGRIYASNNLTVLRQR